LLRDAFFLGVVVKSYKSKLFEYLAIIFFYYQVLDSLISIYSDLKLFDSFISDNIVIDGVVFSDILYDIFLLGVFIFIFLLLNFIFLISYLFGSSKSD